MPPKRMTANPVRPARYRPGKPLPGQGGSDSESESEDEDDEDDQENGHDAAGETDDTLRRSTTSAAAKPGLISSSLRKVDLNTTFEKRPGDDVTQEESESEQSDDEDEDDDVRKGQTRTKAPNDYEEDASDDDSDEDSDESSEEEAPKRVLLRPTFIPKSKRNANESVANALGASSELGADAERRKEEAQAVVEEQIRRDAEAKAAAKKGWDDDTVYQEPPDDTDDLDPAAERAAWKLRELLRIKRERDAIEKMEKEREEIERRRNMDEGERLKEDMEYVKKQREVAKESRGKMNFMQKYYHKGAFYLDDSEILKRDYSTAKVQDDVVNRESLPKALQVRSMDQLGKRGRTKWTHLAAEDTTQLAKDYDKPSFGNNKPSKFEAISGMQDERFLPDRIRDKRAAKRGEKVDEDTNDAPRDRGEKLRERYDSDRPRDRNDSYRPGAHRGDDDRHGDSKRERERDGDRDRYRERYRDDYRDRNKDRDRDRGRDSRYDRDRDDRSRRRDDNRSSSPRRGGYGADRDRERDSDRYDDRKRASAERPGPDKRRRVDE